MNNIADFVSDYYGKFFGVDVSRLTSILRRFDDISNKESVKSEVKSEVENEYLNVINDIETNSVNNYETVNKFFDRMRIHILLYFRKMDIHLNLPYKYFT